ncbi:glycosyltransferase [Micromonospora sp. BRA006-A]|nr:glycosyltransferase [Micromonospora sp. BRA006-A]
MPVPRAGCPSPAAPRSPAGACCAGSTRSTSTGTRRSHSPPPGCCGCSAVRRRSCTCRTCGRSGTVARRRTAGGPRGWRRPPALHREAAVVAVGSPSMADLVRAAGADPDRVRAAPNWTDERIFRPTQAGPAVRRLVRRDDRCVVMHAGTIGARQDLETAVRAAAALGDRMDLVLVGPVRRSGGCRLAADLGADNVRFLERRSAVDMLAVRRRRLPARGPARPAGAAGPGAGKLQAALSCAAPVVASAAGETAELVERARAGLSCPPEDWAALADRFWLAAAILPAARLDMGRRGRDAYLRDMSMRAGVDRIEALLHEAAAWSSNRTNLAHSR